MTDGAGGDSAALVAVAAGILSDESGRILIAQRPAGGHAGGYWEFPGGKLQAGESAVAALGRELREELGIDVLSASAFMRYRHAYPDRVVELHVFLVERYFGLPHGLEGQPLRWVTPEELPDAGLLPADLPIATAITSQKGTGLQSR